MPKVLVAGDTSVSELVTDPVLAVYLTEDDSYIIYTQDSLFCYYEFDSNGGCGKSLQLPDQWVPHFKE